MDRTYLILKSPRILGVVIFPDNPIVTGWRKIMVNRTENPSVIASAQRQVTLIDPAFTAGDVALIPATGIGNTIIHSLPADPSR